MGEQGRLQELEVEVGGQVEGKTQGQVLKAKDSLVLVLLLQAPKLEVFKVQVEDRLGLVPQWEE